jgi:FMN-dependent oxidoreductase (nitrilotriacetate monooxygenase family)
VRAPREVVDLMAKRQLHLVAYMMAGPVCSYHAMWRHPDTETGFLDIEWYAKIARALEYGKFDMVFFPDVLTIFDNYASSFEVTVARGGQAALQLDPMLVLATMASCTSRIGLGATMSTTFFAPYQIARSFATLDHLSRGRAAWNVVTSFNHAEAKNFGADKLPPHDVRYDRADEFIEVCLGLWDTWREGALVMDKRSGVFADPAGIRYLDHEGEWLKCRGPLSVPRSPQGRPVIMQAGASSRGKDFAARWGEVIFTIQNTPELMKKYYDDVKARAPRFEREPDDIKILPTIQPILGETESMAREHQAFVNELIDPLVGLATISSILGFDFSKLPADKPVKNLESDGSLSALENIMRATDSMGMPLGEVARRYAQSELSPQLVGTGSQVADQIEAIFKSGACDGFIITPVALPGAFEEFVRMVVPELQRRGIYRSEYGGATLRDHLELKRPSTSWQLAAVGGR